MGRQGFGGDRRSRLFGEPVQFFLDRFVGEGFGFQRRLASLFHVGVGVLFGQTEDAQAGAIGLFGEWAGVEHRLQKRLGVRTHRFGPVQELLGIDLIHKLVIGRHMLSQGRKTSGAETARMDGDRFAFVKDLDHVLGGVNIDFLVDQAYAERNRSASQIRHGSRY